MRLKDKVALITGAARGIGLGFAEAYAREGARVIIADINIERAEEAARGIGSSVKAVKLDVTDLSQIDKVVAEIDAEYGGIDILVNNAAIFDMAPINELTEDSYERVLDINLKGPLFMMKAVSNVMIKRGRGGKIINMASQAGRRGEALVTSIARLRPLSFPPRSRLLWRSSSMASMSMRLHRAWSTANIGTWWMRILPNGKA